MQFPPDKDPEVIRKGKVDAAKLKKQIELKKLTVTINGVVYDANPNGQLSMAAVGAVANWQFNVKMLDYLQSIANPSAELQGFIQIYAGVYQALYKDEHVGWKGHDNKLHNVQVESVFEALYASMQKTARILADTIVDE